MVGITAYSSFQTLLSMIYSFEISTKAKRTRLLKTTSYKPVLNNSSNLPVFYMKATVKKNLVMFSTLTEG